MASRERSQVMSAAEEAGPGGSDLGPTSGRPRFSRAQLFGLAALLLLLGALIRGAWTH